MHEEVFFVWVWPAMFLVFLYSLLVFTTWPHARSRVNLFPILLFIFFPPAFIFFALYLLFVPIVVHEADSSRIPTHQRV